MIVMDVGQPSKKYQIRPGLICLLNLFLEVCKMYRIYAIGHNLSCSVTTLNKILGQRGAAMMKHPSTTWIGFLKQVGEKISRPTKVRKNCSKEANQSFETQSIVQNIAWSFFGVAVKKESYENIPMGHSVFHFMAMRGRR